MPTATVTVQIPEGWELACGEMRVPVKNIDQWIDPNTGEVNGPSCVVPRHPRVIVRPAWQWPKWLKAAAVAMTPCGSWQAFSDKPMRINPHREGK